MPEPKPCRSCGAPVIWAVTTSANPKPMPIDPEENPEGNVWVYPSLGRMRASSKPVEGATRHVSHFTTCPNADTHRRKV